MTQLIKYSSFETRFLPLLILVIVISSCEKKISSQPSYNSLDYTGDVVRLNPDVRETSGLAFDDGSYWTHNDNGNKDYLFQVDDKNGSIIRKVKIDEIKNNDWEDIEVDSQFVYIGDFGNNGGNRKNLRICFLEKNLLYENDVINIEPEKIKFKFPNKPKNLLNNAHDYDAEAFLVDGDSIYIFSKNWKTETTNLYALPNKAGEWTARLISNFNVDGLVTSATFIDNKTKVALLGYNRGKPQRPFVWILSNYQKGDFLSGEKVRYNLGFFGQAEAIAHIHKNELAITSEGTKVTPAKLYKIQLPD